MTNVASASFAESPGTFDETSATDSSDDFDPDRFEAVNQNLMIDFFPFDSWHSDQGFDLGNFPHQSHNEDFDPHRPYLTQSHDFP